MRPDEVDVRVVLWTRLITWIGLAWAESKGIIEVGSAISYVCIEIGANIEPKWVFAEEAAGGRVIVTGAVAV
jgi:hypothetical protein